MTLAARCRLISALILDVDGVLTSGRIVYDDQGKELKAFHVRDGSAIVRWQKTSRHIGIISGRTSHAVTHRARELGIKSDAVLQGQADKELGLSLLLRQWNIEKHQVAYMGDDLPDLCIIKQVGLGIAPADAHMAVLRSAQLVTRLPGGQGAVGEVIELILASQPQPDSGREAV